MYRRLLLKLDHILTNQPPQVMQKHLFTYFMIQIISQLSIIYYCLGAFVSIYFNFLHVHPFDRIYRQEAYKVSLIVWITWSDSDSIASGRNESIDKPFKMGLFEIEFEDYLHSLKLETTLSSYIQATKY